MKKKTFEQITGMRSGTKKTFELHCLNHLRFIINDDKVSDLSVYFLKGNHLKTINKYKNLINTIYNYLPTLNSNNNTIKLINNLKTLIYNISLRYTIIINQYNGHNKQEISSYVTFYNKIDKEDIDKFIENMNKKKYDKDIEYSDNLKKKITEYLNNLVKILYKR
jgi:hypothetical protein